MSYKESERILAVSEPTGKRLELDTYDDVLPMPDESDLYLQDESSLELLETDSGTGTHSVLKENKFIKLSKEVTLAKEDVRSGEKS